MKQKTISVLFSIVLVLSMLAGCVPATATTAPPTAAIAQPTATTAGAATVSAEGLTFNNSAWHYDAANDVYWQIGVKYCAKPETTDYETLGIYVPGAYLTAKANSDGTYTATPNTNGSVNGFTAKTAPVVFPVETGGYSAHKAPTAYSYNQLSSYLKAGFIYVDAGVRGKQNGYDAGGKLIYSGGAPWGVTDFKAAIRFVRYNKSVLPGNTGNIFVFGMSGGGAQSSVIGASGDSKLYEPYLQSIGAALVDAQGQPLSDAVQGVMAWCPITSLDYADEAYEWNMGQYVTTGTRANTTWTSALSKDLAAAYADYINKLGLKDEKGNVLVLKESDNSIYAAGSYYDYVMATVQESLNNFLIDTTFPYTQTAGGFPGGGFPGGPGGGPGVPPDGGMPGGAAPDGGLPGGGPGIGATGSQTPTIYLTVQDYIASLNKDTQWVTYDAAANKATITSLAPFANCCKTPTKSVGAFDNLNRTAAENDVFGNEASDVLHFDSALAGLLTTNQAKYATFADWNASYVVSYTTDLKEVDKFGNGIQSRMNMYNPMYYLMGYYDGYKASTVAPYWRIRTGIFQGDTANTVEVNLALALQKYDAVKGVDFATVWDQHHTQAERTGNSTDNFIAWVMQTVKK